MTISIKPVLESTTLGPHETYASETARKNIFPEFYSSLDSSESTSQLYTATVRGENVSPEKKAFSMN